MINFKFLLGFFSHHLSFQLQTQRMGYSLFFPFNRSVFISMCLSSPLISLSFRLSNLSSCPGFVWDSSSLSESVFMLLSEFLLFSPSLFSNRSHSAQKPKKSIPAWSREEHSLYFRLDYLYTLMCWYSRMLLNQLCPVWHRHPTHPFPVSVTKQFPSVSALLGSHWVLNLASSVLKNCKFCATCNRQVCWTKQEASCVCLLHFDTKLLRATQIFFLTSFISTHGSTIKAKVFFAFFRKTSRSPPTEVHYSQKIPHLLPFYP